MTTINIYENDKEHISILNEDLKKELTDIKELLNILLDENNTMKRMLKELKHECENKSDKQIVHDKETKADIITIDSIITDSKEKKEDKENSNASDNQNNTTEKYITFQKELLEVLDYIEDPLVFEENIQSSYLKGDNVTRKELLSNQFTIGDVMGKFKVSRYVAIKNIINPLLKKDLINICKVNPHNNKSIQIIYKIKKDISDNDYKVKDDDAFTVNSKKEKELYHKLKLLPNGTVEHSTKKNRKFILNYNIYEILYINELIKSSSFSNSDFLNLVKYNDWNRQSLAKLIYNLQMNNDMKKIIVHARKVLSEEKDFSLKGDLLCIDGVMTYIPIKQAKSWCDAYMNSGKHRDVFVWELQKRFPEINRDFISIILYNVGNNELSSLWNVEEEVFIENNPSRRKNLILNGGLI